MAHGVYRSGWKCPPPCPGPLSVSVSRVLPVCFQVVPRDVPEKPPEKRRSWAWGAGGRGGRGQCPPSGSSIFLPLRTRLPNEQEPLQGLPGRPRTPEHFYLSPPLPRGPTRERGVRRFSARLPLLFWSQRGSSCPAEKAASTRAWGRSAAPKVQAEADAARAVSVCVCVCLTVCLSVCPRTPERPEAQEDQVQQTPVPDSHGGL